jgi:TPR repeat protein
VYVEALKMATATQMYALGKAYETGCNGYPQNLKIAFDIYSELAEEDFPPAVAACAYSLCHGMGCAIDVSRAVALAKKALSFQLELFDKSLCHFVFGYGYCWGYFNENKWIKSTEEAIFWFNQAYNDGCCLAGRFLSRIYSGQKNTSLAEQYNQQTILPLTALANTGDVVAQERLGFHYYNCVDLPESKSLALSYFSHSASHNIPMALFNMGVLVQKEAGSAMQWFKAAAEQGSINAYAALDKAYTKGIGVAKDPIIANYWQQRAAVCYGPARKTLKSFVMTEVFPGQVAFTTGDDPRPLLATSGAKGSVAIAGYERVNKIAFIALFSEDDQFEENSGLILYNIFKLAKKKITEPVQLWFSHREEVNDCKPIFTYESPLISFKINTVILPSLMLDARTGEVERFSNRVTLFTPSENPPLYLELIYRPK